jgi:integrase/recombinase XerD
MYLFEPFLQERTYLKGVSPATLRYYLGVRRAFGSILANPAKEGMVECIQKQLSSGVSAISVNAYLRGLKAYVRWLHAEGYAKEILRVQFLKAERKVLATFNAEQVQRIERYRPAGKNFTRAHTAMLVMLDSGLRVSECLGLRREDVDLDNLILRVRGKGNKHRLVPMSIELRRALFRFCGKHSTGQYVFSTARGTKVSNRNLARDMKLLCERIRITGV